MIKNGRRLLIGTAVRKKRPSLILPQDYCCSAPAAVQLPAAFLLPAWQGGLQEKPIANKFTTAADRKGKGQQYQARRHGSSHATVDVRHVQEDYPNEWLASDSAEHPTPVASTSKAILPASIPSSSRSAFQSFFSPTAASDLRGSAQSTTAASQLPKSILQKRVTLAESSQDPSASAQDRISRTTASNTSLDDALELAHSYLESRSSKYYPANPPSSHDSASLPPANILFPASALSPTSLRRLLRTKHASLRSLSKENLDKASYQMAQRLQLACKILEAAVRQSSPHGDPLSPENMLKIGWRLRRLLFLSGPSTTSLLDSLQTLESVAELDSSTLFNFLIEILQLYMWREAAAHRKDSFRKDFLASILSQDKPDTIFDNKEQNLLHKHIRRSLTTIQSLPRTTSCEIITPHLPILQDLLKHGSSAPARNAAVALETLNLLHWCMQVPAGGVRRQDMEQICSNSIEIFGIVLNNIEQYVQHIRSTSILDKKFSIKRIDQQASAAWSNTVEPALLHLGTDSSVRASPILAKMHRLALNNGFDLTAACMVNRAFPITNYSITGLTSKQRSAIFPSVAFNAWKDTIRQCLKAGHVNEARMLLNRLQPMLGSSATRTSTIWHQKLQAVLISGQKTYELLQEIEASDYRPDHHFLKTLLRGIPTMPISLDETCDIFHAALSLAEGNLPVDDPASEASLSTRLAAIHGDLTLFERGAKEAVQLPWTMLASSEADKVANMSTSSLHPLDTLALEMTRASQILRSHVLQGQNCQILSAYKHTLAIFKSALQIKDGMDLEPISHGSRTYESIKTLWSASFIRALSFFLQCRDLQVSIGLVEHSLTAIGSNHISYRTVGRVLAAACSPTFHIQSRDTLHVSKSQWQNLAAALAMAHRWANDIKTATGTSVCEVDTNMTRKQRLRAVATRSLVLQLGVVAANAIAKEMYLLRPDADSNALDAFKHVLDTLQNLHARVNYNTWWKGVEKEVEAVLEGHRANRSIWQAWEVDRAEMREICRRVSEERHARVGQAAFGRISMNAQK